MAKAAAKNGDSIEVNEVHMVVQGNTTAPNPFVFTAKINAACSSNVNIMGQPAAMRGSEASGDPSHSPSGKTFASGPANKGAITAGSSSVKINGQPASRDGDAATGCGDATPPATGKVVVNNARAATVFIGD